MEDDQLEFAEDEGWRNSLAPNDGYYPRNRRHAKASDRRSSSRLSRRNSSIISLDMFNNFAYGMIRHMRNPEPNAPDQMMYKLWKKIGFYLPLTGILAVMDFVSDWMNSLQLIKQDICQENIFGNMMMITLTVLPFIYAWILPNDNEQKVWEKLMRVILRRPAINPYEKWTPPKDDMLLYYTSFYLYVLFSPFTHVVSQVYVHISHASKVDHYMEYKTRTLNVIKHLQEGQFVQFDEEELHKLKALQHRATQYVMYYCKYAKSRLKFCLVEDAIQYNIQMALLIFTAFSPIRDVHRQSFDYSDGQNMGSLAEWGATPSTIRLLILILRVWSLFTSVLSMWISMYQSERFHEMLSTNRPISLGRIVAVGIKTLIEMLWPTLTVVLFAMDKDDLIPQADVCPDNIILISVGLYCIFPLGYTFVSHLLWAFVLNVSNCNEASIYEVFLETVPWSIYSACLTIKYSRLAGNDETTRTEYYATWRQYLILLGANMIKFALPTILMLMGTPKVDLTPETILDNHIGVFDSMSFRYEFEYPVGDLKDPVIDIIDYTDEWQFVPSKISKNIQSKYPNLVKMNFDNNNKPYYNEAADQWVTAGENVIDGQRVDRKLNTLHKFEKAGINRFACEEFNFPSAPLLKLNFCVWGPRRITGDKEQHHYGVYASLGNILGIKSLNHLDAADLLETSDGQYERLFEMRNERLVLMTHIVDLFCNHPNNTNYACEDSRYSNVLLKTNHQVMADEGGKTKHTNRMVNLYDVLRNQLPPQSTSAGEVRTKLMWYMIGCYLLFTIAYVFAEIDFPVVSKAFRFDFVAMFYPYFLPSLLFLIAIALTWMGIMKSTKTYCEMNPDSDKIIFGFINLDCIDNTEIKISPDENATWRKFRSMSKCGLGMVCKYCAGRFDCDDEDNWIRLGIETTPDCYSTARKDYPYDLLDDYVHSEAYGSLRKLQFEKDDHLTCYFDAQLISQLPIGYNIDPIECPQVVRRMFKEASNSKDEFIFKFGFVQQNTERIRGIQERRKKIYGETDAWNNVPQVFPQPSKLLEELTYTEWLEYSWNKMSTNDQNSLKKEVMTLDMPKSSCLNNGKSLISGFRLHNGYEIEGPLLTHPKKRYALQFLLDHDLDWELFTRNPSDFANKDEIGKLIENEKEIKELVIDYFVPGKTMGPAQDVTTDGYYSLIQRSLLIVVDSQDEFVHRFHQPFEVPYFGYQEFNFEEYAIPTVDETECTPDDIYSWDHPFEETNVTDCGTTKDINEFFGGSPGSRKYKIIDGKKAATHVGFHGCPALYGGKMMIFGAGPNMHDYMHEMYNEYYNTWQINRDRKFDTKNTGCTSRIAKQLNDYAKNFWQTSDGDEDQATFKYVAPLESYGNPPFGSNNPAGYANCQIRHVGQSYSREYYATQSIWKPIHYGNKNIRSCQVQSLGRLDPTMTNEGWDEASKGKGGFGHYGYLGPNAVKFFFIDLTGDKISKLSDWSVAKQAYSEKGFTHPHLGNFFNKFEYVLPVHGINMDTNKLLSHLNKAAETVSVGQLVQAVIQNEGFDQIFSYLFNFKNCEKRDIQYTNLFKGEVDRSTNNIKIESIRKELVDTGYAELMRTGIDPGSNIGSYKSLSHARDWATAVSDWEAISEDSESEGRYLDNSEYSFYRWTYFFDYEEDDYNEGPEIAQTKDNRWSEETRLSNALLWLRDYDNSQSNRRELLKSTYLINRFSYPDANQDGRKFIHGETTNEDAFSAFSPIAFAENPLSFVTPLRSERTDSTNEMSSFVNDVMYTPQRWGVYPFKGVSMKYHQPVMEEYNPNLFNKKSMSSSTPSSPSWNQLVNHKGHFWNWTYQPYCQQMQNEYGSMIMATHWFTSFCPLQVKSAWDLTPKYTPDKRPPGAEDGGSYGSRIMYPYPPCQRITKTPCAYIPRTSKSMVINQFPSRSMPYIGFYSKMNPIYHPSTLHNSFVSGMQWYWLNKTMDPVEGYLATTAKPHCFLASDHDIGGFMEPFYRDTTTGDFKGELNMTKYLEENIWGQPNAIFRADDPYFKSLKYKEGPLTTMMNKSMFLAPEWNWADLGETDLGTLPRPDFKFDSWGYVSGAFTAMHPWKYGLMVPESSKHGWMEAAAEEEPAQIGVDAPWLFDRDRWYRQCNFLKSLELVNFNLDEQDYENDYHQFDTDTFDDGFSVDTDGFLDAMLNLNKPCPIFDDKVWLFGRIRKTQEIRSRNTEEFNWNHLRQAGLHHSTAGKIMPLRLSSDKWLNNDMWDQNVLWKYGNHLKDTYGVPVFNDDDHADLETQLSWTDRRLVPSQPYEFDTFKGFTHREIQNTLPTVWGMNITGGNEMYVPPVYGANYGLSMFNDVEKTYPHPYTVSFTYEGTYKYRGMVPNSISPQWGACITYNNRLVCLGGMICYHHSRKNAAFSYNRGLDAETGRHDDSMLCDNLDDSPHNMAISPKDGSDYEWETSLSNPDDLSKFQMPIGLLGHSAIVIKKGDKEQIHVFGGMWGKMSNYKQFTKFYEEKSKKAKLTQSQRRYSVLYNKEYLQTWDNSIASQTPEVRRSSMKFKPNQIWSPADVSYAITHNAVAKLSLIYEEGTGWTRGPQMNTRRFGHTSIYYAGRVYHIGGHYADGVSNAMESWKVNEASASRRKRSSKTWDEGIPYNPKPFLYDGWSHTNYDHDPTLQNYFFRNGQDYTKDSVIFKDQDGNLISQQNGMTISDYFDNYKHNDTAPFFENVREAYMSKIKYAPCKYCIYDSSFRESDTTLIQSLGNSQIYKWNAAIPPRNGQEWNSEKKSFDYMKFDINRMSASSDEAAEVFGRTPEIVADNAYFNDFQNFFPLVFNVPTKSDVTVSESFSLDDQISSTEWSVWRPDCKESGDLSILPGLSLCNP